jgi:hypothetical protein
MRDFAPISRDQSVQVRLASAWLMLNAVLALVLVAFVVLAELTDRGARPEVISTHPIGMLVTAMWSLGMFKAGRALSRKSILGGYAGLLIFALPLLLSPLYGGPSIEVVLVAGLGIVAIITAWGYLESTTSEFSITEAIAAAPATVWAVIRDGERWPEWTPSVTSVRLLDPLPLAVGSRARIRQPGLPPATWRVTELTEGREFTWTTAGPGIHVIAHHSVEPSGSGTQATLSIRFEGFFGPLVGWMTSGKNVRYLVLEAAGLKRRSEGTAPAP